MSILNLVASATPTLSESMVTAFTSAASEIVSTVTALIPVLLPIISMFAVVGAGIKIFRKLAKG